MKSFFNETDDDKTIVNGDHSKHDQFRIQNSKSRKHQIQPNTTSSDEINGRDNEGHLIQWKATRNQRKFKELEVLTREFMAFSLERLDRAAGRDGFVYVTDNGGAGFNQCRYGYE
ncbi:hypothetical protein DERF_012415 [Dermatophagoides farinae]|uniref:Uncharacterized protein n=1 Tax=Dermatophagoides farinae TaxID=6954 RepID=A0A922KXB8_DERFA|nr:hypothetical protein DERF_012415 [Dermatophagoides farinae]